VRVKAERKTELIVPAGARVEVKNAPSGWGPEYQAIQINAQAIDLTVKVGKRAGISIRVNPDGDVIVTNYGGYYMTQQPQNVRLENGRPWSKVKE
jgi:hypothetical protein